MTELTAASPLARHSGAAAALSTAHRAFGFALVKKQADWSPLSVLPLVVLFPNIPKQGNSDSVLYEPMAQVSC